LLTSGLIGLSIDFSEQLLGAGRKAHGLLRGELAKDFATSRAHSIKRSTSGLNVRFFSVTIVTGHGRTGKSTGKRFNENLSP
jgi:hypothetical protein